MSRGRISVAKAPVHLKNDVVDEEVDSANPRYLDLPLQNQSGLVQAETKDGFQAALGVTPRKVEEISPRGGQSLSNPLAIGVGKKSSMPGGFVRREKCFARLAGARLHQSFSNVDSSQPARVSFVMSETLASRMVVHSSASADMDVN